MVPVNPDEISDNEPRVVLVKDIARAETGVAVNILNSFNPDFVLNLMGGSAGIYNLKTLINPVV